MADPQIVRDQHILSGRWRVADTLIAVADIQSDYASQPLTSGVPAHFSSLTADEISLALEFRFHRVREPWTQLLYGSIMVACECGEDAFLTSVDGTNLHTQCRCGKTWTIEIGISSTDSDHVFCPESISDLL